MSKENKCEPDEFVNKFEPIQDILNKLEYSEWYILYDFFEELFTKEKEVK